LGLFLVWGAKYKSVSLSKKKRYKNLKLNYYHFSFHTRKGEGSKAPK